MKIKFIFGIVIYCFVISECSQKENDVYNIGNDLVSTNTKIAQTDTFTVNLSTVKLDSIITSGYSALLIGNYTDGNFGTITSSSVFAIGLSPDKSITLADTCDSITLMLKYNGYYYGDTTIPATLSVHKLTEQLTFVDGTYNYSTTTIKYDDAEIGSLVKAPTPSSRDFVSIRLTKSIATDIFRMLRDNSDTVSDEGQFLEEYLPGLMLKTNNVNSSIIGYKSYDTTLFLRLYFRRFGESSITSISYDFPLTNSDYQYNQIHSNYGSLPLSMLTNQLKRLPSSDKTGDESYLQAGVGLMTRVDFPYLNAMFQLDKKSKIISAYLLLKPAKNTYDVNNMPDSLIFYATDKLDRLNGFLANKNSTYQYGYLSLDNLYNENTYYSVNITTFLFNELAGSYYDTDHGLLVGLRPSVYNATCKRLIFSGVNAGDEKPKLIIKYVFYD